jgi:rRNA maturation endonuclease Nob1
LKDTLLSLAVLVGILGLSAIFTSWFARTMYNRCAACGTLNARRRDACRSCGKPLK